MPAAVATPHLSRDTLLFFWEVSRAAAEAENMEEALRIIARHAAEALDAPQCVIYEYEPSSECIVPRAIFERTPSGCREVGRPLPLSLYHVERAVLDAGQPLLERISDPALDPASPDIMKKQGERTCLVIPLGVGSEPVGLLAFYDSEPERDYEGPEMALARGLAALAGQALHNARLLRRMEERNAGLASVLEANRAINSSLDLDEVLEAVANHAAVVLGCGACVVYQGDEDNDGTFCTEAGIPHGPQVLREVLDDAVQDPAVRVDTEARDERSRLVVPLFFGRSRLGTMVIQASANGRLFTDADIDLARGLAEQAGRAIHNARQ